MPDKGHIEYNDYDIKFDIGPLTFNILYIRYVPARKDWYVKSHCHSSYELHFITKGSGKLRVNTTSYDIRPGTLYLTGPGIFHEQEASPDNPMDEYCINFDFKLSERKAKADGIVLPKDIQTILSLFQSNAFWFGRENDILAFSFRQIFSELENRLLGYDFKIKSHLQQIIITLVRCFTAQAQSSQDIPLKLPDDRRRLILDWYLGGETNVLLPLDELSKKIGLSTRQINRIIKEYYSMNFKEKQITTKLESSKILIQNKGMSLSEVASLSGFSSLSHFCYMFKKYTGMTPTNYRKNV